ncbi:MAG: hypothetical protein AB7Q29_17495 [Vicinamibacterales bacterium]
MRRRFLVRCVLILLIVGVVLPEFRRPVQAFEGEHFVWTYYLALHVGYTKRQAYQIASAAYAVDWDPNTGPMEAGPLEVVIGAQHPGMWYLNPTGPNDKVVGIWQKFHAFANVTHCVLTQEEQEWLASASETVADVVGNIGIVGRRQDTGRLHLTSVERDVFKVLPLCTAADRQRIADERRQARADLWALARSERNPGPLIHFVQDTYPHGDYTVVRGHAMLGHLPDFLDSDMAKAWAMTEDTIAVLQQFMREVLGQEPREPDRDAIRRVLTQLAAANPASDRKTVYYNWSTWDPGGNPTLTDALRAVSLEVGSPLLDRSLEVIRRMVDIDERTGRLPPKFPNAPAANLTTDAQSPPFVDDRIPSLWIPFRFNPGGYVAPTATVGGRAVEPRYGVERVEVTLGTPQAAVQALGRDRARVTFRFPYRVANAATLRAPSGAYLSPLPVLETLTEAGQAVHHHRLEGRGEGEHAIETWIERDVTDLERAVVWDVTVHPYGLDPVRQQTTVRPDVGCAALPQVAPSLNRLRALANGMGQTVLNQRQVRNRALNEDLPGIERDRVAAAAYLTQVEGVYDQVQAACRAASLMVGQVGLVRNQLDEAVRQATLLRSTALNLAGVTCEIAARIGTASTDDARANIRANAAGFAAQTRAKAAELEPVFTQARAAQGEIERVIQQARLRELVEQDGKRQAAVAWFGEALKTLNERIARVETTVADLPDPLAESETLASAIRTPLNSCLRTTAVRAVEVEAERLVGLVRDAMSGDDLDLEDVTPLADWTRQSVAAFEAVVRQSRIQRPACQGAADLMAQLEPQPRDLSATVDTIGVFVQNSRDASAKAESCAADAARARAPAGPPAPSSTVARPPAAPGVPVYRILETRIEPQIINRPDVQIQVVPGLQASFQLANRVGAASAAGQLTVTAPQEIRGHDEEFTISGVAVGQWNLGAQVFQWLNVNVNVMGRGDNQTTGQEMHPPGAYSARATASVTSTVNKEPQFARRWEEGGRRYLELRVGFGVALTEYGVLVKYIYATDQ